MSSGNAALIPLCNFGLIITPNNRLAAWLLEYLAEGVRDPDAVWRLPRALPFSAWVDELARKALLAGMLPVARQLDVAEELLLWQQVVAADAPPGLLSTSQVAAECQRAATRLAEWQLDPDVHRFELGSFSDGEVFLRWYATLQRELQDRGLLTRWQLQQQLLALAETDRQLLHRCVANAGAAGHASADASGGAPGGLALYGFNSPTPIQLALAKAFGAQVDCKLAPATTALPGAQGSDDVLLQDSANASYCLARRPYHAEVLGCAEQQQEWQRAAVWARQLKTGEPAARVAVVVPELTSQRAALARIFRAVFSAAADAGVAARAEAAPDAYDRFEISAGEALASVGLVRVFLDFFAAAIGPLSRGSWSALLNTPYLWPRGLDCAARAAVLKAIYASGEESFRLDELSELLAWFAAQPGAHSAALARAEKVLLGCFRDKVGGVASGIDQPRSRAPVSLWLQRTLALLRAFGWPGARALDSTEYQQHAALLEWCEQVWRADALLGDIDAAHALHFFRQQLTGEVFHAQTRRDPARPPVQLLGVLEAEGQLFDYLWICGLSDQQWPLRAGSAALLPAGFQAARQMPGASAERELAYASNSTARLLSSTRQLVMSCVLQLDAVPCGLSPLVRAQLQLAQIEVRERNESCAASLQRDRTGIAQDLLEKVEDSYGLPLLPQPDDGPAQVSVRMLGDYARSPLHAYLRHRLGVEPWQPLEQGLGYRARGIVVHATLQSIWQQLQAQQALLHCPAHVRAARVDTALQAAATRVQRARFRPVPPTLLALQLEVLQREILAWLSLEAKRPAFEVSALEQKLVYRTADAHLVGKADRVDRLADGSQLLLDYKTGGVSLAGWFDARVSAPQLPAYALALLQDNAALAGVAYARIGGSEPGLSGIASPASAAAAHDGLADPAARKTANRRNFDTLLLHWRDALQKLLTEAVRGFAAHEPGLRKTRDAQDAPYILLARDFVDRTTFERAAPSTAQRTATAHNAAPSGGRETL
ncbi:MAG: PD-(D/E)XK nuclease family protein [Pseudomonadales bacterium]